MMTHTPLPAHLLADAVAALAKMRRENAYLRLGLTDLVGDDTRLGGEMREVAQAILEGSFRQA